MLKISTVDRWELLSSLLTSNQYICKATITSNRLKYRISVNATDVDIIADK